MALATDISDERAHASGAERVSALSRHDLAGLPLSFRMCFDVMRGLRVGALEVRLDDGRAFRFEGREPGPEGTIIVRRPAFLRRVLAHGGLGFAEAYLDGDWDTPDLRAVLSVTSANVALFNRSLAAKGLARVASSFGHFLRRNTKDGSRRNIAYHYDLGNAFYGAWLDETMSYSSARFTGGAHSLEDAQIEKYRSLARLMALEPGQHVLEIGSGWGGFAEVAAREFGVRVTGITISREQFDFAQARMARAGLSDRVEIRFQDYRDVTGHYDRVASIEMFEAVGEQYWPAFFGKLRDVLKPGGRAGLQLITVADHLFAHYRKHTDFIQKYIFPGGMLASEAALERVTASQGLAWTDTLRFGQDYARTLGIWHDRFMAAWPRIEPMGFDERFRRMWSFYLASCEAAFRSGNTNVIQMLLARA